MLIYSPSNMHFLLQISPVCNHKLLSSATPMKSSFFFFLPRSRYVQFLSFLFSSSTVHPSQKLAFGKWTEDFSQSLGADCLLDPLRYELWFIILFMLQQYFPLELIKCYPLKFYFHWIITDYNNNVYFHWYVHRLYLIRLVLLLFNFSVKCLRWLLLWIGTI